MNTVLKGLTGKICEVYLDDIIIYSETLSDHVKHVEAVVQRLRQHNLKVKLSKCKIAQQKIQYLSHVISHGHIQPSKEKVKDLDKFQAPLSYSQIHSFIGLASYYRKFVKNFASIISPLLRAAQTKHIQWTEECQTAFNSIKSSLQVEPVLKLPDFAKPFSLNTDACKYGIGAVLTQLHDDQEHPVAYYSKHLTRAQRNYSTTERELLAIVFAVQHFKQFLYGGKFTVWSDHQPLKHLLSTKEPATRLLRLLNKLSTFDYEIKYKKGIANADADALSRIPLEPDEDEDQVDDAPVIINYMIADNEQLNDQQKEDSNLEWLFALKQHSASENQHKVKVDEFANREQQCYYKQWDRIHIINKKLYRTWTNTKGEQANIIFQYIVPFNKRIEIMQAAHDSVTSGHLGSDRTISRIAERFYWPGWEEQVNKYVISCSICQQAKASHHNNRAPLQPLLPNKPMELIASDLMGPFTPKSKSGNEYILIITDHFSKYVELFALRNTQAKTVAKHLIDFICRHGIPDDILTDQGTNYQSELLDEVYRVLDIHRKRTAAYHPQSDGISERHVQHFKNGIRTYLKEDPQEWDKHLNTLAFAYNSSTHATTKHSPFYLMTGRHMKIPLDLFSDEVTIDLALNEDDYAHKLQTKLKQSFQQVQESREYAVNKAKIRHNRNCTAANFEIGDYVWRSVKKILKNKSKALQNSRDGPYVILNRFGETTYEVKHLYKLRAKRETVHRDRLTRCHMRKLNTEQPNFLYYMLEILVYNAL